MLSKFERALQTTFMFEGGFVNDPDDSGGATNLGITEGTLARAKSRGWVPQDVTVKTLTKEQAATIYRKGYWEPIHGDELPSPVAEIVFDAAVNHGVGGAGKLLQRALNAMNLSPTLVEDGVIGPKTLSAVQRVVDLNNKLAESVPESGPNRLLKELALLILLYRTRFYVDIVKHRPTQKKFLYGWIKNRVVRLAELLFLI